MTDDMTNDTRARPLDATPDGAPRLVCDGIAHRFGQRWALRGVSLTVHAGEAVAITGHNGSGKSTLLRIFATAIRATRGQASVAGADVIRDADVVRTRAALLSTDTGVYGDLSAEENLRFALRMLGRHATRAAHTSDTHAVREAIDAVGLAGEYTTRARVMSTGMQRRLSIARLLLWQPPVLLLDEPYNSLDTDGAALVNRLARTTLARGGSVLLVAHDLSRSDGIASRTLEMRDGELSEQHT
jgi:heme exporter protein A